MKLDKGLINDVNIIDSPNGSWRYAKNLMVIQQGTVSNEYGFSDLGGFSGKVIIGRIELPTDEVILFLCNPTLTGDVYLGNEIVKLKKDNTFVTLVQNNNLKFNPNYPVSGVFKYNNKKELIILITDDNNPPRLINLKSADTLVTLSSEKDYNLFLPLSVCTISSIKVQSGGSLKAGVYQYAFKYRYKDNSETQIFFISNPIPIFSDNSSDYDSVWGNKSGSNAFKSIRLNIAEIDTDYKSLIVYSISTIDQITIAQIVGEYSINASTKSIIDTGVNQTVVALSEILTSFSSYTKVKKFTLHQDWVYGINVATDDIDFNYQSIANNIVVKWNAESIISLDKVENSYKDPSTVFIKKGFTPNEVYALYIRFILKNGGRSEAYHIPGRAALTGEKDQVSLTYLQKIDSSAKNFHLQCTAQRDAGEAKGLMGYWENETETYPNNDRFGGLANTPVRHHRFPDYEFLKTELGDIITEAPFAPFSNNGAFPGTNATNDPLSLFVAQLDAGDETLLDVSLTLNGFSGTGTKTYPKIGYIVPKTSQYNFTIEIDGTITETTSQSIPLSYVRLFIYRGTVAVPQAELLIVRNTIISSAPSTPYTLNITYEALGVELNAGDHITIVSMIDLDPDNSRSYSISASQVLNAEEDASVAVGVESKILGLELSNINFPDAVKNKIQGYEILYAQKGLENSQIIGQGLMSPHTWHLGDSAAPYNDEARFYSFDMLFNKPASGVTHIKANATYGKTDQVDLTVVAGEYDAVSLFQAELQKVNFFKYYPENNTAVLPTNIDREEYIYLKFAENLPTIFNNRHFQVELHSLKKDIYLSFDRQVLVSTGKIFKVNAGSSLYSTGLLHGGDTFLSPYSVGLRNKVTTVFHYKTVNLWVFSASNISLRYFEDKWNKKYYPVSGLLRNLWEQIPNEELSPDVDLTVSADVEAAKRELVTESSDFYGYNLDYSRLNSLVQTLISINATSQSEYPYRIIRSLPSIRESDVETWRNFPAFDYYEMPKEKGELWNIDSLGEILLIHQEYMLYRTRGNGVLRLQSNEEIQLGEGDVFEFRPAEVYPLNLSYAGTKSMYACLVCKLGYVFIDGSQGRIFAYSESLEELSNKGNLNFFNDNFKYTGTDNPYLGQGFSLAFDNRYNRLLVSLCSGSSNITRSYSLYLGNNGAWVGDHEYKAGVLFNTPNKLLSIEQYSETSSKNLFLHNDVLKRCIYYDSTPRETVIHIPIVINPQLTQRTYSIGWIMDRFREGVFQRDKTFDEIFLYNSYQATNQFDLIHYDFTTGNLRNMKNTWLFDFIRNISNGLEPIVNNDVNPLALNVSKPWYDQEEFDDKYIVVRFVYKNTVFSGVQDSIFLYDVTANNVPRPM